MAAAFIVAHPPDVLASLGGTRGGDTAGHQRDVTGEGVGRERMGHTDHPRCGVVEAAVQHVVATHAEVPVLEPRFEHQPRGSFGGPPFHEARWIDAG